MRAPSSHPDPRLFRISATIATAFAALLLASCASAPQDRYCQAAGFLIDANFDGGNFHSCEILDGHSAALTVRPEDAPPINQSPWYSFRISRADATPVSVTLTFEDGYARYWPKLSRDGRHWTRADESDVSVSEDGNSLTIRIADDAPSTWVAGQEIVDADFYERWINALAEQDHVQTELLGSSVLGRPLHVARTADRPEVVFLIGRQHPPEVSGALAMRAFVNTVLGDSQLARDFRARYTVIVIPLINPDGVALGHWRHNVNGADLNRDWGPFTQPETQGAERLINAIESAGMRPALMLDFHSTRASLFYTQLAEETSWPVDFATVWFERFRARRPDFQFKHDPRPRSGQPNTKNYFFDRYRIPAFTYEIGDEEDRNAIRDTTPVFAEEMMRLMLEYTAAQQTVNRDNPNASQGRPPPVPLPAQ